MNEIPSADLLEEVLLLNLASMRLIRRTQAIQLWVRCATKRNCCEPSLTKFDVVTENGVARINRMKKVSIISG